MSNIIQWVNLYKSDSFVEDEIKSDLRLGKFKVKCKLKKGDPALLKLRLVPEGSDNIDYSDKELKRNINFRLVKSQPVVTDGKAETEIEQEFYLPAAGGNQYKVEALYNGKTVATTKVIEARRKLYYQTVHMKGVSSYSLSTLEDDYWNESKKYYIRLTKKGSDEEMPFFKTLNMSDNSLLLKFMKEVDKKYKIKAAFKLEGFVAVFSHYIASKALYPYKTPEINTSTVSPICKWNSSEMEVFVDRIFWYGMEDGNFDKKNKWIGSKRNIIITKTNGTKVTYAIPRSNISIMGTKRGTYGGYHYFKVKLDSKLKKLLKVASKVKVEIDLYTINGWTNGFSWSVSSAPNTKVTTTAKATSFNDMPKETQDYTWVHEVGHKVGMAAIGVGKSPDKHNFLYGENRGVNDKNHSGPHCENGATFSNNSWSGTPKCVMFGANGVGGAHAPKDFCPKCEPQVRKLDLT